MSARADQRNPRGAGSPLGRREAPPRASTRRSSTATRSAGRDRVTTRRVERKGRDRSPAKAPGQREPIRSQIDPAVAERRRAVRSEQRRRRRRSLIVVIAVVVVVIALTGIAFSPLIGVRHIRTSGFSHLDRRHVEDLAEIVEGSALLRVDLAAAQRRIESDPWIANARVRRSYPTTILIDVTEERPLLVLRNGTDAALVSRTGRILEFRPRGRDDVDFRDVPGVTVPVVEIRGPIVDGSSTIGEPTGRQVGGPTTEIMRVVRNLPGLVERRMTSVEADDPTSMRLMMDDGSTVLLGPAEDVSAKMAALGAVLEGVDDRCIDRIDVRNPVRVTVTRRPDCVLSE